jgi:GNAT superfamily N-acetyltransferase
VPAAARTTASDPSLAARARAFDAGVFERGAEEVVRLDGATVISTPSLPTVPHLNTVVVHDALDADAIEALAGEHHAGIANRRVVVEDEAHGERLAAELQRRGWAAHRLRLLGRGGDEPPPEAPALAEEVPYGQVRGLREEWLRSAPWALGDHLLAEGLAGDERLFAGTPTRAFAVFEQGRPLAYALLLDGGRDGALEDVYTTPEARGRGLASAVVAAVLHAARAERHEAVFVPTDADDGASALYERLGFAPLAVEHIFSRTMG